MRLRRQIVSIHKWIGLTIALFLGVQCVSGLLLVYRAELHAFLADEPLEEVTGGGTVSLEEIVAKASAMHPAYMIARVVYPTLDGQPYIVYFNTRDMTPAHEVVEVSVDRGRVVVLGGLVPTIFDVVFRLHHIVLSDKAFGRYFVGLNGLFLTALLISGVYIWWPGIGKLGRSLRIGKHRNPVTFFWQLHRTIGVTGMALVFVSAVTGVMLSFGPELRSAFVSAPTAAAATQTPNRPCDQAVLNAQILSAKARFPAAAVRGLRFRGTTGDLERVLFVNRSGSGLGPPHQVWLQPCSAGIAAVSSGDKQLNADGLLSWMYPIHTGIALGYPGRTLTFLSGMALLASLTTGVLLWNSRNRLKRAKRRAS